MKKIKLFVCLLILMPITLCISQQLHTPREIFKIVTDSKLVYEIGSLEAPIVNPDYLSRLTVNTIYRTDSSGIYVTHEYKLTSEIEELFEQVEKHFNDKNMSKARELYLDILNKMPSYYLMMTYIGQTYEDEKNYQKAIEWLNKAIDNNYIDYMAHWFLADDYFIIGKNEEAIKEITLASILNRNNPRVHAAMRDIYTKNKLNYPEWRFIAQYKNSKDTSNKISVKYKDEWLTYALCKAVWEYEPGYAQMMGQKPGDISFTEEKECLVGLLSTISTKKKYEKQPYVKALNKAIANKMIDEYILYEILLPQYPSIAFHLSKETIDSIIKYVIEVRGK